MQKNRKKVAVIIKDITAENERKGKEKQSNENAISSKSELEFDIKFEEKGREVNRCPSLWEFTVVSVCVCVGNNVVILKVSVVGYHFALSNG